MGIIITNAIDWCVWYHIANTMSSIIEINTCRFTVKILRFPLYENYIIMPEIAMEFVFLDPILNAMVLVKVMVCQRTCNTPLLKQMKTRFIAQISVSRDKINIVIVCVVPNTTRYTHWGRHNVFKYNLSHKNVFLFIFGTACQIYCYGRYCVRRSVSPQVPENPSGPLVDNFIVLPCVAFGVTCVKLLPGVDRWNSLDEPRVIGPCHCEVWGWPRH